MQSILTDSILTGEHLNGFCNAIVSHHFTLSAEDFGHLQDKKNQTNRYQKQGRCEAAKKKEKKKQTNTPKRGANACRG